MHLVSSRYLAVHGNVIEQILGMSEEVKEAVLTKTVVYGRSNPSHK